MIKVGISHGDINGVGYEVILKTFETEEMLEICTPVIYGSPKVATFHRKAIDNQTNFIVRDSIEEVRDKSVNMINCFGEDEVKVCFGVATADKDEVARKALDSAIADVKAGHIDVLVAAPCTFAENENGSNQVSYIKQLTETTATPLTIMIADGIRIASATESMPLEKVSDAVTKDLLQEKIQMLHDTLQRDFCIEKPRIAVVALNPKDGEGEFAGSHEKEIIEPLVKELFDNGKLCFGPYSADYIFSNGNYSRFDAILTMYHDQAVAPFKALTGGDGTKYVAGLPLVVTSPAHDAAYDIAGKGIASECAMRNAIYSAIDAFRNRRQYERIHANPLRKQYYEKRDDSDKLKLDQVNEEETY